MSGSELKRIRLCFLSGALVVLCYLIVTEDDDR